MKDHPYSIPYSTGRLVLKSPCSVGKDAFTTLEGGNKFCSQCKKVVYDLRGRSEAEIKTLIVAHGGNLCGSIAVRSPVNRPTIRLAQPLRKPAYFKHWVATASLLLLYHGAADATIRFSHPTEWTSQPLRDASAAVEEYLPGEEIKTNTLISAVVLNQDSMEVPLDVEVAIYARQVLVAKVIAYHGLLKMDLTGKVRPEEPIGLVIRPNTARYAGTDDKAQHGGLQRVVRLRDAQNVQLQVQYHFPEIQVDGGVRWEGTLPIAPEGL